MFLYFLFSHWGINSFVAIIERTERMSDSGRARSITGFQKKSTKIVVDGATVYGGFF